MVAAAAIETATNPVTIQREKNRAPTGPAGPSGAPARLPAATVSDESNEAALAQIFSTTTLTAPAFHTKRNPALSALVSALIETGAPGPPVLPLAAMRSEHANAAILATLGLKTMLNPATCLLAATRFLGLSGPAARLLVSWAPALVLILGHATTKLMSSRLKLATLAMATTPSGQRGTSALKHASVARNHASENTPAASAMLVAWHTSSRKHKPAARKATGLNILNIRPAHRLAKADS
jgi:hypothetical protein